MKKSILLIVVAVAVMFFAMAATAYADTSSGFVAWSNANPPNGGAGDNPHQAYSTTTVKCAVCHAVHKAPDAGQVLLDESVADACVVCHITSDAGGKVIYTGTAPDHANNYSVGGDASNAHNAGTGGVTCVECHTVHGAGRILGDANGIGSKILKSGFQSTNSAPDPNHVGVTRDESVTGFCSQCHPYFVSAYGQTVVDPIHDAVTVDYHSHIMKAEGTYGGVGNISPGATISGVVAYGPSTDCRDCHDAGLTGQTAGHITNSFPHRTPGAERFLQRAPHASFGTKVDAVDANSDGVCLKCHADGTAAVATIEAGVGVDY